MAGKKKKSNAVGTKGKGTRVPQHVTLPEKWASVAEDYLIHQDATLAAISNGISVQWCYDILNKPIVKEYIQKREPEMLEALQKRKEEQRVLNRGFMDEHFMKTLVKMERKPSLATAKMFEVGYKVTGDILPPRIVQNQQQAQLVAQAGSNAFDVYKAKWLRDREAGMSKQLEAQYSGSGEPAHQE